MSDAFRHQVYSEARPQAPFFLLRAEPGPGVETAGFRQRMRIVGDAFRQAGVSAVYLVHGTFMGGDAGGLWTEISRIVPGAGDALGQISKKWTDAVAGERGNYTEQFARTFEEAINAGEGRRIPVRLFHWSSENHHVGRAHAAVRLLDELAGSANTGRVLLWGHSHGGNVFALISQLLGADDAAVERFFQAAEAYYRHPLLKRVDLPVWPRVRDWLNDASRPRRNLRCDFVTFGTPIRYGWDPRGCAGLLHVVNHRPAEGRPEYLAPFPPTAADVLQAAHGDFIQQLGIAGTNVAPNVVAWRALLADRRLNALLQPNLRVRDLLQRLKAGMRVPEQGTTLLCDYGPAGGNVAAHLAGHAVYTQTQWLLFHAEQAVKYLYARA